MNLTRVMLTAAVAAIAIGGATLATTSDASARGKGFGRHGGHGIHFRHFGHRWHNRHFWRHRHFFARYNPCWKWTRHGWVYICGYGPY